MTTETKDKTTTQAPATTTTHGTTTRTLEISGMTCASCVRRVERALGKVEGVESANVNFASETALVTADASVAPERLVAAVEKAGYGAKEAADRDRGAEREKYARRTLGLVLFGAALAIPTVVLSMAIDIAGLSIFGNMRLDEWL